MNEVIRKRKKWKQYVIVLFSFFGLCLVLQSCMDGATDVGVIESYSSDPNSPVEFIDFTPNKGGIRTRMFINGSNFGTDVSKIKIKIGGKESKVIHSSGTQIYTMVPARADGGNVEVEIINSKNETIKHVFDQKFEYEYNSMVGTLCGIVDQEGKSSVTDGTFDKAGTVNPRIMLFDNKNGNKDVYFFENVNSLRKIDLLKGEVTTVIKTGTVNWSNANAADWSTDKDTMFINDVTSNQNKAGVYYFLRKEGFAISHNAVIERDINCVFTRSCNEGTETNHSLFLIRGNDASLLKATYDSELQLWKADKVGSFGNSGQWYQNAVVHPSGKYVYCISRNQHCIQKALYNEETKTFERPNVFVGNFGVAGYNDAPGTSAQFNTPIQGCFVKNEEYERQGLEDIYDFYVVDCKNHCIRMITPEGIVSTFAGRGSVSTDGIVWGYIDGDLRKTARFRDPVGICYDEESGVFYVSDEGNKRIRTISVQ